MLDNRTYRTYLWSGPLATWQAIPAILARGRIRDDREYEIVAILLTDRGSPGLGEPEREIAARLAAEYTRGRAV